MSSNFFKDAISLLWLICFICLANTARTQPATDKVSLNDFFAGIPVVYGYNECKTYIAVNPLLGIDSVNERGIYSSLKAGMKSHFPFPDSVQVKVLLSSHRSRTFYTDFPADSVKGILIEAVFKSNKAGKKAADKVLKEVGALLKLYYTDRTYYDDGTVFQKGKNEYFPNCTLSKGYFSDPDFYYVLLEFWGL